MRIDQMRSEVEKLQRQGPRTVAKTAALYAAIFAWGVLAMNLRVTAIVLAPALLGCFLWITWRVLRKSAAASRALAAPEGLLPFYRAHLDEQIAANRGLKVVGPILVGTTWLGVLVAGVHAGALYWIGAVLVSVSLLVAAVQAHHRLPRLAAKRAKLA